MTNAARILALLGPHLEKLDLAWSAQPADGREPTLPLTIDGKVNVTQLAADLEIREKLKIAAPEQYFHRDAEIAGKVNIFAAVQGVKPIGSRMLSDIADAGVRRRLGRDAETISDLRRSLAEREAANIALREENTRLKAHLDLMEETGLTFRSPA
jgi:hypothetical protein